MSAPLRMRMELNKGRVGIPLRKLAEVARETERFLDMLCADSSIAESSGKWLARNFNEGSLSYDVEFHGHATDDQVLLARTSLTKIASGDITPKARPPHIRKETLVQFGKLANHIDIDEKISMAVYKNGEAKAEVWHDFTKQRLEAIAEELLGTIKYYGSIQGRIHALYKESDYISVRNLVDSSLVRCVYRPQQYRDVYAALNQKDAIVHIAGMMIAGRIDKKIEEMTIDKIKAAPTYRAGDLDKFFGCAPQMTGRLSTSAYLARIRNDAK